MSKDSTPSRSTRGPDGDDARSGNDACPTPARRRVAKSDPTGRPDLPSGSRAPSGRPSTPVYRPGGGYGPARPAGPANPGSAHRTGGRDGQPHPPRPRPHDASGTPRGADRDHTPAHNAAADQPTRSPRRAGAGTDHNAPGGGPHGKSAGGRTRRGRPPPLPKPNLSAREIEVLLCWFRSDSKADVSAKLGLAPGTISTYLSRIRVKYELVGRTANSKASLVARAVQDGLISLDDL